MQNCDVYIAHKVDNEYWSLPRSKWASPYGGQNLDKYAAHVRRKLWHKLDSLEGKLLGCWCEDEHGCHGDVLVDLLEEKKVKELNETLKKCGLRVDPTDLSEIRRANDWIDDERFLAYATRLDKTNVFYFQTTVHLALQQLWGVNGPNCWRAFTNDDRTLWIVGLHDGPQPYGPFWDDDANFENIRQSHLIYNSEMPHFLDLFAFAEMLQPSLVEQPRRWEEALREATLYLTLHRSIVRRVGKVTQIDMDDHDLTKSRLVQFALAYAWHWGDSPRDQKLLEAAKLAIKAGHCEVENHHLEYEEVGFDKVDAKKLLVDRASVHVQKDPIDKENGWAVDPKWIPDKYAVVWEALKKEHKHKNLYTECLWKANKELKPHLLKSCGFADWWMPPHLASNREALKILTN